MSAPYQVKVNAKYGAPMGRYENVRALAYAPCNLRRVPMSQGYDEGGAYWGNADLWTPPLWCAWNDEAGTLYVRANSRAEAARCVAVAVAKSVGVNGSLTLKRGVKGELR